MFEKYLPQLKKEVTKYNRFDFSQTAQIYVRIDPHKTVLLSLSSEQITYRKFAGFVRQAKVQQLLYDWICLVRNSRIVKNFFFSHSCFNYFKVLSCFLNHRFNYTSLLLYKQFSKSKIA